MNAKTRNLLVNRYVGRCIDENEHIYRERKRESEKDKGREMREREMMYRKIIEIKDKI